MVALNQWQTFETSTDPDPNPRGGVNYLTLRVQFYANE